MVKLWHDSERRMGHQVDKGDISLEFKDRLNYHVLKLEGMQAKDGLDKQDQEKLGMCKAKVKIMEDYIVRAERQFADRVCAKMGVKLLAPQIYSQLTANEEAVRCELTWQQFDERVWLAGCASEQHCLAGCQIQQVS